MSVTSIVRPVLLVAVAASALLAGCGAVHPLPGGPQPPRLITERDHSNGKTIHIGVGDKLALILGSSYWNFAGSSAPSVLRQEGNSTLVPTSRRCPPGVGCQPKRAVFKALAKGTAVITAHRLSCGEALRCTGSQGHFKLTVVVR